VAEYQDPTPQEPAAAQKLQVNAKIKAKRLISSSGIVSAMTLLSRLLGMVRDILVAQTLGASALADAFFVAFKVPNFLRRLFAEGAFSQAFVPVLSEYKLSGRVEVRALLAPVVGILGGATFVVSILAMIFAPTLVWVVAPGFVQIPDKLAITSEMMRITFPYLFFVSLVACASGVLNTYQIFAPSAFAPVLLNATMIAALVWFAPAMDQPALALAWSVVIAGALQLLLHWLYLAKIGLLVWPRFQLGHPGVKKIFRLMGPGIFGVSVSQINLLLDTVLASFLVSGSVAWLYYADRLVELPLGVFGIAIATVILPHLSSHHQSKTGTNFRDTLDWGVRWVVVLGLPAAAAMLVLAQPILMTLFFYGEFELVDVQQSAAALQAYCLALLPFMLIKIFATGYFSRQDTKTPVKIGILAMGVNMLANLALIWHFDHVGLALATGISAWLNAGLLYRGLHRQAVYRLDRTTLAFSFQVLLATGAMVLGLVLLQSVLIEWQSLGILGRVAQLGGLIIAGLACYGAIMWILGVRPGHLREP